MLDAHPDLNPDGFFESQELLAIRVEVENLAGINFAYPASWSRPDWSAVLASAKARVLIRRACSYFAARREEGLTRFIFKDPRTIALMPFWERVFKRENLTPRYVVALRKPCAVNKSIQHFSGQSYEMADLLWMENMATIAQFLKDRPFALVVYERWFEGAEEQIHGLSQFVFGTRAKKTAIRKILNTTVKSRLNHAATEADVSGGGDFSARYYGALCELPCENAGLQDNEIVQLGECYVAMVRSLGPKLHPDSLGQLQDFDRRERSWADRIIALEAQIADRDRVHRVARARQAARGASYFLEAGQRLIDRGRFRAATHCLTRAHTLAPALVEPPFFASISTYLDGDRELALAWARTAVGLCQPNGNQWAPRDRVAQILIQLGRFAEADEAYIEAISLMPQRPQLYRNRAALCRLRKQDWLADQLDEVASRLEQNV